MPRRTILAALLLLTAGAHAASLAPHRALYTLTLRSSRDQAVIAASGVMSFELQDVCTGIVTAQHIAIDLTDRDGRGTHTVSDYATFERRDGKRFDFHSRETTDGDVTQALEGSAVPATAGRPGRADYASGPAHQVALPAGTLFPNAHTRTILEAAEAGRRFLSLPLFDGTSPDGAQDTFVTIGKHEPPAPRRWPALSALGSTRVHVAFFDRNGTAMLPDYEIGMRYFDNGVASDLTLDFGDFVMRGELTGFEPYRSPRCGGA